MYSELLGNRNFFCELELHLHRLWKILVVARHLKLSLLLLQLQVQLLSATATMQDTLSAKPSRSLGKRDRERDEDPYAEPLSTPVNGVGPLVAPPLSALKQSRELAVLLSTQ